MARSYKQSLAEPLLGQGQHFHRDDEQEHPLHQLQFPPNFGKLRVQFGLDSGDLSFKV